MQYYCDKCSVRIENSPIFVRCKKRNPDYISIKKTEFGKTHLTLCPACLIEIIVAFTGLKSSEIKYLL